MSVAVLGADNAGGPTVQLHHEGKIEGETITVDIDNVQIRVNQFLGIPYAEAPLGKKRFAKPIQHPGWNDTKKTNRLPPACWQYIYDSGFEVKNPGAKMWINNTIMDEDCLYLNVWAPVLPNDSENETLPVMVWIYGGGFTSGSSSLAVYNGSILAATQKVVVVSMQYRVGAFGFLWLNNTEDRFSVTGLGNQGLLDQATALAWVQYNIASFGGNSSSVTVFGESAGAVSTSILWLSQESQTLFHRAILQSGSVYARWGYITKEEAEKRTQRFVSACGCGGKESRNETLTCLQNVPAKDLVEMISNITELVCDERQSRLQSLLPEAYTAIQAAGISPCLYFDVPFAPVQDDIMVPENIDDKFSERTMPIELLLGVNKNEAMYFLLYGISIGDNSFLSQDGQVNLPNIVNSSFSKQSIANKTLMNLTIAQFIGTDWIEKAQASLPAYFYDLGENATYVKETIMDRLDKLGGDLDFICPTLKFAEQASTQSGAKVYFYSFEQRSESFSMPEWVGVMHGYEIEYVFGMPRSQKFKDEFYSFNQKEQEVSDNVMKMWANFARSGDPNLNANGSSISTSWPQFKSAQSGDTNYLIIKKELETGNNLRKEGCQFWSSNMKTTKEN